MARAALVCGPPHGGACCVGAWPPSWRGVLCWWLPAVVVVHGLVWWCLASVVVVCWVGCGCRCDACLAWVGAVLVRAPPPLFGACRVCAWPPLWWGVLFRRVQVSVGGVGAGLMLSLFCWLAAVSAAVWPALSGVGCLWCLPGGRWCCVGACPLPPLVGACCVCAWPPPWSGVLCWCVPPPWSGVLRSFVAPLMVGHAVLVPGSPLGGACCVGACPPRWWCLACVVVVCWLGCGCGCVVCLAGVGAVLVRAPPPFGACRVCAWPPPWSGVLCRRVRVSVRRVVAGSLLGLFCWFAVVSAAVRPALSGVGYPWLFAWPGRTGRPPGACGAPPLRPRRAGPFYAHWVPHFLWWQIQW